MNAVMDWRRWTEFLTRSDILVSFGIVAILMVMIIPLHPLLLDVFLAVNITVALLILIISLYVAKALEFSLFPTILLGTTLFRLSLNVASTRLILLHGDEGPSAAGNVIQAFGQFVVGGDYVVGSVLFIILVIINFMVITKGAGRVAEVAARFTLDAMPGKQMAIDADLNAGLIDDKEARSRRKEIAREADFYGAMDGASKFVRGDAIAGILITFINIGAGFVIGVVQKGMEAGAAAQNYTILTVGDGLVGQVPALIISTAAGILVTRTAGTGDFGTELKGQFTFHPRAIWIVAAILAGFALIPGFPHFSFLTLSAAMAVIGYRLEKSRKLKKDEIEQAPVKALEPKEDNFDEMLHVDLLELEVGYALIPLVDSAQNGELLNRIRSIRKQFAADMGFIVPPVHIKDNLQLKPNEYSILLKGVRIAGGEILPGHCLAMNPGGATETIKGVATVEPAFGLPATWISEDRKNQAQMAGYTVVDGTTVISTHLSELIKQHAHEILGRQEVQNLLDNVSKNSPKLVEELVPNLLPLGSVMHVLRNLLRENVPIRDMRSILETLADRAPAVRDPDLLTEYVRQALARSISMRLVKGDGTLPLFALDRALEDKIQNSLQHSGEGSYMALDPVLAQKMIQKLGEKVNDLDGDATPVLLCTPLIRPHVKRLTERYLPNLMVLSHNEISPNLKVKSVGTVKVDAS
ncbi:MAG: flagellar biosynthesis protein FlhA [Deltaproteobacteria bacterium]|nr:flagellar biosynthesis protein FlhA [Deltaproteobacteria bacterium]